MAKISAIQKNLHKERVVQKQTLIRKKYVSMARDKNATPEERFAAQLKLSSLPRDGSKTRLRNRCGITGRPRGFYRKFKMSRIALRELASDGKIPGIIKASW
jgi:small subunit ribosomal protein S14